jgi:hypothetical protein
MKTLSTRSRVGLGRFNTLSLALVTALSIGACSSDDNEDGVDPADASGNVGTIDAAPAGGPDAMPTGPDAMAAAVQIPAWTLEDIQPESPKFGQVYGLSEFNGKILIAVLVEGF